MSAERPAWVTRGFEAFRRGRFGNGGQNLLEVATLHVGDVEDLIERRMASLSIDVVGVAIIADREIVYEHTFGGTGDVVFQGASLSKMITAAGSMNLVRDGLIAMDAPLDSYLPAPYLAVEPSRPITLEDVLTHTSGLTNDVSGVKRTLHFQPGEYFRYSGTGFNYLQHVIEAVTSQTYRTWAANTVLPSAGMASSYFDNPGGGMIEAGAGLMTTPGDVSRFLVYLTDPAATDMPGDARSQMLLPHVQILEDQAWGLGDRCSDRANRKRDLALGQ